MGKTSFLVRICHLLIDSAGPTPGKTRIRRDALVTHDMSHVKTIATTMLDVGPMKLMTARRRNTDGVDFRHVNWR